MCVRLLPFANEGNKMIYPMEGAKENSEII